MIFMLFRLHGAVREAIQETVIDYELDTMVCQNYFC